MPSLRDSNPPCFVYYKYAASPELWRYILSYALYWCKYLKFVANLHCLQGQITLASMVSACMFNITLKT